MVRSWFLPPLSLGLLLAGALAGASAQQTAPRGFLGIAVAPDGESDKGIAVQAVAPDSPAAKAGVKSGDVITKVNGKAVPGVKEFLEGVAGKKPGDKLELQLLRDGKEQTVTATLAERPAQGGGPQPLPPGPGGTPGLRRPAFLGVQIEPLTAERAKALGVKAEAGVVVMEVIPKSPAAQAGLQTDDVITAVNKESVRDPDELRAAVLKAGAGKEIALTVWRGKEEKTLKAALKEGGPGLGPRPELVPPKLEPFADPAGRIRELERRIEELQKRLEALEKKQASSSK
jgi:S1-C subfamily serine protease